MRRNGRRRRPITVAWAFVLVCGVAALAAAQAPPANPAGPPRILLDLSPRAVEYQLRRLTNDELATTARRPADPRYRLVYYALLTRTGLAKQYRDEALDVLVAMDGASRPQVLLRALGMVPGTDDVAVARLAGILLDEPIDALRAERAAFEAAADASDAPGASRRAAYAVLLQIEGTAARIWPQAAASRDRLADLLGAVPLVVRSARGGALQPELAQAIAAVLEDDALEPSVRAAAVSALGAVARERAAVEAVLREFRRAGDEAVSAAAVGALQQIPLDVWPQDEVLAVAHAIVASLGGRPPSQRTSPAAIDALQLGERLAAALPADRRTAIGRDLAALGIRVVRIETVPEQMRFTQSWFVVEAGARVQIVLFNPDAMPHNVVVGRPGTLQEIGTAGGAMSMPADPAAKPFVPDSPSVIAATPLVWEGETARLNFVAPKAPGEYVYLCTYPGHWARMYGVMLVVERLEAWEANRVAPRDPLSGETLR
ncbi:MAG: hypothetical protein IT184_18520 [Acidobacteria bacterium]|nr:hypothetical protein [Acidobacteriota bacterium]